MTKALRIGIAVLACAALLRGGCTIAEMENQRGAIPAKIKTGWFYAEGDCGDILSYQGAYVFSLRGQTIAQLETQGPRFFDDIGVPSNEAPRMYFGGGEWRPTPVPGADNRGDGALENMYCAMSRSWLWPKGLAEAMQRSGGFYKASGGRYLIVLPKQGYIVAIASDR